MNTSSKLLYFDIDASPQGARFHRARHLVETIHDVLILLIVTSILSGLLLLLVLGHSTITPANLIDGKSRVSLVFWIAMLGSSFLVYRFNRWTIRWPRRSRGSVLLSSLFNEEVSQCFDQLILAYPTGLLTPVRLFSILLHHPSARVLMMRTELPYEECRRLFLDSARVDEPLDGPTRWSESLQQLLIDRASIALGHEHSILTLDALFSCVVRDPTVIHLFTQWPHAHEFIQKGVAWTDRLEELRRRAHVHFRRQQFLPHGPMNVTMTSTATPLLDLVCHDLTEEAKQASFIPMLGRDHELSEIWMALEGDMRHLTLVGTEGVGKSALLYDIAQRIIEGLVPNSLHDIRMLSIEPGRLFSGAGHTGDIEERLNQLLSEVARARNVVLVFEQIEQFIGFSTGGTFDIIDQLLREIEKSSLIVFATTTPAFWRSSIEQKTGFTSIFHKIDVSELTQGQCEEILTVHATKIESQLPVLITVSAVVEAARGARIYLHDEALPGNAVRVLDQAAAVAARRKPPLCTAAVIDEVLSSRASVPVGVVGDQERELLMHFEERLSTMVVGQTTAIRSIANALRRSRAQLENHRRPIGTFLFVGPTGVGKTMLAKSTAQALFGQQMHMIRVDMSEYQDARSVERLLGVPGSGHGGIVTEEMRSHPYSLLLFDELEKAHPQILTLLLQLLDEGRLTDVTGRTIDATNMLMIATSNTATSFITQAFQTHRSIEDIHRELIDSILPTKFPPEFVNRFDDIIIFEPLTSSQIQEIAARQLTELGHQLSEQGIQLSIPEPTLRWIAQRGTNAQYGARPLRRAIQDTIENKIAQALLQGTLRTGMTVRVLPEAKLEISATL